MPSIKKLHELTNGLSEKFNTEDTTYKSINKVSIANLSFQPFLEPGKVCISDEAGLVSASSVPVEKLAFLSNLKEDTESQILAKKSNVPNILRTWDKKSRLLADSLDSEIFKLNLKKDTLTWTLDDYDIGETNKCIINNSYTANDKLIINGTVSAKSMNISGNTNVVGDTINITTESLFIKSQYGTSSITINKNDEYENNIIELKSDVTNPLLTMTSNGNIGIGKTNPVVNVDVVGNIKVKDGVNNVSSAEINYLSGVSSNIQNQIDVSIAVLENGSNVAILSLDADQSAFESLFTQVDQSITNVLNASNSTTSEYITNSCNMYVTSKQNILNFDNSLSYNPETRLLSVSKFRNVWATNSNINNGEEYIAFNNINVYNNYIELEQHALGVNSNVNLYPPEAFPVNQNEDSGVLKTIGSDTYSVQWSSVRTFGDGSRYSTALYWFDGNDSTQGHMKEGSYPGGVYQGAQRIVEGYNGEWVILGLPNGIRLNNIVFKCVSLSLANSPTDMRIYGSYDSANWETLYENASVSFSQNNTFDTGEITGANSINAYKYIGICFNKIGASATTLILSRILIYGIAATTSKQPFILLNDLDTKHDTMTGAISSVVSANLAPDYVLISDSNGKIAASSTKVNEISYISDVSSPIQSQLNTVPINNFETRANQVIADLDAAKTHIIDSASSASNQVNNTYNNKQELITFGNGLSYDAETKIISLALYIPDTTASEPVSSNSVASFYWITSNHDLGNEINYEKVVVGSNYIVMNGKQVVTDEILAQKQDVINLSTGLVNINNTISLAPSVWTDNTSNIQYNGVYVYDNKIVIEDALQSSKGTVDMHKLFTNYIIPIGTTYDYVRIGDNVDIKKSKIANTTSSLQSRIVNYSNGGEAASAIANNPYCMKLSKDLWMDSSRLVWTSDIRIKKNIQDIDDDSALEKILAIEPKTYKYVDYTRSDATVYGFVSQQIEKVFPHATKKTSRFIPNIFQECAYDSNEHSIILPTDFDVSKLNTLYADKFTSNIVPIYDESDPTIISSNIIVVDNENRVSTTVRISPMNIPGEYIDVNFNLTSNENGYQMRLDDIDILEKQMVYRTNSSNINVFVYGTQIDDLITIDKSYIYTLNTCATQVLSRKIDVLQKNNTDLASYVASLEQRVAAVKALKGS